VEFEYCHLAPRATRVVVEDLSKPRPLESLQLQYLRFRTLAHATDLAHSVVAFCPANSVSCKWNFHLFGWSA